MALTEKTFKLEDLVPSFRRKLELQPLDLNKLIRVAIPSDSLANPPTPVQQLDRHKLFLTDGKNACLWEVDTFRSLFRGDKQPPALGDQPDAYMDSFLLLELHVLEVSKFKGDPRDTEMKEIYSTLRRRPDGRGLGFIYDYMWQAAALVLGTRALSQAEFEAILSRLERSCRTFEMGPGSRNYIDALRQSLPQ
jgi:hypothetical protein